MVLRLARAVGFVWRRRVLLGCLLAIHVASSPAHAVIIGHDDRMTLEEFAASEGLLSHKADAMYSARGEFLCGKAGTAQVALRRDVLVTAAHLFHDSTCEVHAREVLETCQFRTMDGALYGIDPDTLQLGGCGYDTSRDDWAVVKLLERVPESIVPYDVFEGPQDISVGTQIVHFSSGDENLLNRPSFHRCQVRAVDLESAYPVSTDCDTGNGSSGAAQLVVPDASAPPAMLMLNVGESPAGVDGREYDYEVQFNVSIPVDGAFREAIVRAATP